MKRAVVVLIVIVVTAGYVLSLGKGIIRTTGETDNSEVAWQCQGDECRVELFTVGGRPENEDPNIKVKILVNHGYAVGYSETRRNPLWAVYVASKLVAGTDPERYDRPQFFPRDLGWCRPWTAGPSEAGTTGGTWCRTR